MSDPNMEQLVKMYVKIRTKKQQVQKEADEALAELDKSLSVISGAMKEQLVAAGATSAKTAGGTAYIQPKTRYYAMDWDAFGQWVLRTGNLAMFEKRIAQSNMKQHLEDNPNDVPPGLQADTEITVTVRKS
jgi:hypothetical protein